MYSWSYFKNEFSSPLMLIQSEAKIPTLTNNAASSSTKIAFIVTRFEFVLDAWQRISSEMWFECKIQFTLKVFHVIRNWELRLKMNNVWSLQIFFKFERPLSVNGLYWSIFKHSLAKVIVLQICSINPFRPKRPNYHPIPLLSRGFLVHLSIPPPPNVLSAVYRFHPCLSFVLLLLQCG